LNCWVTATKDTPCASNTSTIFAKSASERATGSAGSRTKGLLRAFKLLDMAEQHSRRLDGAHLLPLVRGGTNFVDGVRQDRSPEVIQPSETEPGEAA
jgi:hypothetical protein